MMILLSAPAAPFGRKVKIVAKIVGLDGQITGVDADTASPSDSIRRENPLGKIPTLILENGTSLYDSRVIVEYLDHLAGGGAVIPADPTLRFRTLTLQALADGIMDASLLQVYEQRWRPESQREPKWVTHHADKVQRGLEALAASPPAGATDIGHIALACALGYLDLRFNGDWRGSYPALVAWLDRFSASVPAYAATAFKQP